LWDDLFRCGRAAPSEFRDGSIDTIKVFHFNVILNSSSKGDSSTPLGRSLLAPLIDEKLVIDPETRSVVSGCVKGVRSA
jgi:hypothetical protein